MFGRHQNDSHSVSDAKKMRCTKLRSKTANLTSRQCDVRQENVFGTYFINDKIKLPQNSYFNDKLNQLIQFYPAVP
jgi:hypothetical protein